ncbi:MAG: VWA domain-containing protein [Planctomycetes bacterium]|nr:VWA domain-containing protein [Planctomycetota bacterium]
MTDPHTLARWRLVLGKGAEAHGITCEGDGEAQRVEQLVGFLFDESKGKSKNRRHSGDRDTGGESDGLSVPDWVDAVNDLFPQQSKEIMQKELVRRRGIADLLEKPELLEKIEPNMELVKTLMTHRDLMNPKTRVLARKIIDQVVEQLKKRMQMQVEQVIIGAIRKDRHSPRKVFRNLDLKTTLRRNLKNFDRESGKLFVDQVFFFAAERKKKPWHVVVVVDQSGSMMESTVFSSIMASIFAELPAMKTSLILYDTRVVDMSDQLGQPVDVLMKVQLGGGNDTALALKYATGLIRQPARTILVLISDFYEGDGPAEKAMVDQVKYLGDCGVRLIGLAALGYDARPFYNKPTAVKLKKVGMDVLVCTPEKLAECMAEIIRG